MKKITFHIDTMRAINNILSNYLETNSPHLTFDEIMTISCIRDKFATTSIIESIEFSYDELIWLSDVLGEQDMSKPLMTNYVVCAIMAINYAINEIENNEIDEVA